MSCTLIHGDCLVEMQKLIDDGVKVDLILTDPPYGIIKGLTLRETANFRKELTQWDEIIPIKPMFDCCYELLNDNRNLLLFCKGDFSFQLYNNQMGVSVAPVNYIEEIFVYKRINGTTENQELREYAKELWEYLNVPRAEIDRRMGNFKVNHFFRFNGVQFSIPSREAYEDLTDLYNLKEYSNYKSYDELLFLKEDKTNFFKLKKDEKFKRNVLQYNKIYHGSLHPTQKPVP